MRVCEGESAKLQIRRSEITMMQRRSAKVGRRKCEGAKAKKRTTFAPSHFLLLCLRSSLSCGSSFFSRRGGGSQMIIVFARVGWGGSEAYSW